MKFYLSILAYLLMAAVLAWGILLLMAGKPMVLIVGFALYLILLIKNGCLAH